MQMILNILSAIALLGIFATSSAVANVTYTYTTNSSNPLHGAGGDDYITISFVSPFALAANSAYNISTTHGPVSLTWQASDSLLGIVLTGLNAPVHLAPYPGLIDGGALSACTGIETCFGGAVITNSQGEITSWNLVAFDTASSPYLVFITYNNQSLGSIDALGSTINGNHNLQLNTLNGQTGIWASSSASVPEPPTYGMLLTGLALLGLRMRHRTPKLQRV